jgi:hypothetical protein
MFRLAYAAAPTAVVAAIALLLLLGAMDLIFATKVLTAGVVALVVASMVTFAVALASRNERVFLGSVLLVAAASALADLPPQRGDAGVLAAIAGAMVLCLIEAGGSALEPKRGGIHLGRPGRAHVAWVIAVATGGAGAGWLLLSLQDDLGDLGIVALAFGVLAAVGMIVFTGALTGSVLSDAAGAPAGTRLLQPVAPAGEAGEALDAGLSPPGLPALSRRDRRRARDTRSEPHGRRPRSTPSS